MLPTPEGFHSSVLEPECFRRCMGCGSDGEGVTEEFEQRRIGSRGFGILDVGYKNKDEVWAAGGSGSLFVSYNQGQVRRADCDMCENFTEFFTGLHSHWCLSFLARPFEFACADPPECHFQEVHGVMYLVRKSNIHGT